MYQPKIVASKMKTPVTKEIVFTFGKHKGKSVEDVLSFDPSYLVWCLENLDWFDVDTGLEDEIYEADMEADACSQMYDFYDAFGDR